jgi:hypothetical protein
MKHIFFALLILLVNTVQAQQCLFPDCSNIPAVFGDLTPNDPNLWNHPKFQDVVHSTDDLSEAPVDIVLEVEDTCGLDIYLTEFELFLDLDGNGTQETVVPLWNLSTAGNVNFGNAGNPLFGFGDTSAFDSRPVPMDQKYQFAVEITGTGSQKTAKLRWVTAATPNVYITPELPVGVHKIVWKVGNIGGEHPECSKTFQVSDTKPPTVVCLNGLAVNIMPTGIITVWAVDFLQYVEDNSTPSGQIQIAIRRSGTGTGIPIDGNGNLISSITFSCQEQGVQLVELWAIDAAGNTSFCETYIIVGDFNGVCGPSQAPLVLCTRRYCDGATVSGPNLSYFISGTHPALPPFGIFSEDSISSVNGCTIANIPIPPGANYTITPSLDTDPTNGVNVLDLLHIARHILGLEPLPDPYSLIAADANRSGSITTFDIIDLRKLITGIYTQLPNNTSWRFIDSSYQFPNLTNPFQTVFPEVVTDTSQQFSFFGIKVGDVDCSAWPGGLIAEEADEREALRIIFPDLQLLPGETRDVPLRIGSTASWNALQMALRYDLNVMDLYWADGTDVQGMDTDCVHLDGAGGLKMAWFTPDAVDFDKNTRLMTLRVRAKSALRLRDVLQIDEHLIAARGYDAQERSHPVSLHFEDTDATATPQDAWPNPTAAGFTIPIIVSQAGPVEIQVHDAQGRLTWSFQTSLSNGQHRLDVPATALPQPGTYFWTAKAGGKVQTGKVGRLGD